MVLQMKVDIRGYLSYYFMYVSIPLEREERIRFGWTAGPGGYEVPDGHDIANNKEPSQ